MTYDELMDSILTAQEQMIKHGIEANSVTLNGRKYGKLIENCPPNIKPTVFSMAVKADYALPDDFDFLVQYEPPKPQTNADCIRAMPDEKLADFLAGIEHDACCASTYLENGTYIDNWLDWLKQEADE